MNFRDTGEQAAFRQDVRNFLRTCHLPATSPLATDPVADAFAVETEKDFVRQLAARRWLAPSWPRVYGGAGMGVTEQFILNSELAEARAPRPFGIAVGFVGPTLIVHGTEAQKKEHLPAIMSGEVVWCQGFSEPGAGSDLASLQTDAIRDGDGFVVNGQKIWTSGAHWAEWMILLVRTDRDAPKHRGISMLLVDMRSPGLSIRPLLNMAGKHEFNEVFFDSVRVPASNLVGELNRGWYVAQTTLAHERSNVGSAIGQRQCVEDILRDVREAQAPVTVDQRNELAERYVECGVAFLLSCAIVSRQTGGESDVSAAAAQAKLYSMELNQRIYRTAMRLTGLGGQVAGTARRLPLGGALPAAFLRSAANSIEGGTSEIQRTIIAVRRVGLPRE